MKYLIPIDLGLFRNDECVFDAMFNYEISDKRVREIEKFILDGHFTGELVDIPGKIHDDIYNHAEDVAYSIVKEEKIDNSKGLEFRFTWVLPAGILALLSQETLAQIDMTSIFEYYEVKNIDELFSLEDYMPIKQEPRKPQEGMFMKTLAIRQPWASLIAMGIKDIECREAMPTKCRKIFIAASGTMVKWDELPDYVQTLILDLEKSGKMPAYKNWPTKCIVGHADIVKVGFEPVESIWGRDWDGMKYTFDDAQVLDEPLYGLNKATPYFYNVDGYDEKHLPASHKFDLSGIKLPK